MKIIQMKVADLIPYENNPRINDDAVESVANSILEFGFKVPIIIDRNNVIVAGHTRRLALMRLGFDTVDCYRADDLTDEQIKAFRLADNKVSELSKWNFAKLEEELKSLEMDMSLFNFDVAELSKEFDKNKDVVEDEFDIDESLDENTYNIKRGQVWKLGNHYLMCGDATSKEDVEKLMGVGEEIIKADLFLTDPPYNVAYQGKTKNKLEIKNDKQDSDEFNLFLTDSFGNAFDHMKAGSSFYIWYASREHINFEQAVKNNNQTVREVLIWNKNKLVLSRQDYHWKHEPCLYGWKDGASHNWYSDRKQTTVLEFDKPNKSEMHPTMKPIDLISYQIKNSSKENDVVLDLFGGSGTTLIACEQLNRNCRMLELDEKYCGVIIKRWETLTNEKAVMMRESVGQKHFEEIDRYKKEVA